MNLSRRGLLAATGLAGLLAGCGTSAKDDTTTATPKATSTGSSGGGQGAGRHYYGADRDNQFADLRLPSGTPRATVVLLHGGYWLPEYGLDLMEPLAERFVSLGYATWNVEYRRTGAGGGVPNTLTDVATAIDRLAGDGLPAGLDDDVVLVGHSAGGHLAAWAASRSATTPGGAPKVRLREVVSLSGVLDLTLAATRPESTAQVTGFVGGTPDQVPEKYAVADPTLLVPASCPVWAFAASEDQVVPAEQSETYVARATAAGARAERVVVPGDHFTLIDPSAPSFATLKARIG